MTVSAVPGTFNKAGIREVVYTIKLPLTNLVLPVPAEKTLDAGDVAIDGFQLQLGVLATVTANAQVADFATKLIPDSSLNMDHFEIVEKPIEGAYQYTLEAKEFEVNYYDGDEVVHTDKATILNYTGLQIWNGDREGLRLLGYKKENGEENGFELSTTISKDLIERRNSDFSVFLGYINYANLLMQNRGKELEDEVSILKTAMQDLQSDSFLIYSSVTRYLRIKARQNPKEGEHLVQQIKKLKGKGINYSIENIEAELF